MTAASCDPEGESTVTYVASGIATGPYPGTFQEKGTVTFGPFVIGGGGNVIAFQASFTIDSPVGQVIGTKGDVERAGTTATCEELDPSGRRILVNIEGNTDYDARIETDEGTYRDRGISPEILLHVLETPTGTFESFEESFASALTETEPERQLPTAKEQCKNGGWQTYGVFKNQGDCVSFVETGGENPPSG